MENVPTKIIVHHDGVSRKFPSLDVVNEYHKGRGFPLSSLGFYVGYHYWIEKDGTLTQTRYGDEEGAHCTGENRTSIGIGLAGNFDEESPTEAQEKTLGRLLVTLCDEYALSAERIYPHRAFSNKTCYGSRLSDDWAGFVYLRAVAGNLTASLKKVCDTLDSLLAR